MSLAMQPFRGRSALQATLQEMREERKAMRIIHAINPKHMFKINNVEYQIMVLDPDAKPKRKKDGTIELPTPKPITGSQIHGVFKTFLDKTDHSISEAWLSGVIMPLTAAFVNWLLNSYTSRYRGLDNEEGKKWLADACRLVIIDWIMIEKYKQYKAGDEPFADDSVRAEMETLMAIREAETEEIKGTSHSFKHNETAEERDEAIDRRHNQLMERIEGIDRPKREVLPEEGESHE